MTAPVHELAPSGTLVAGTNFGNPVIAQRDPAGGEPRGVGPELARELARRLGVPIRYALYDTAGAMADAAKSGAGDVAFLAVDPARAMDIAFSAPYVLIEGTYLVRADSPLARIEEFDRADLRIAVVEKSAYHLFLARTLHAPRLLTRPTFPEAMDALRGGEADVVAGIRQPLAAAARAEPGLRVVEGAFMAIGQACGVPQGRPHAARCVHAFIEDAKACGLVARALAESGIADATIAPPAK
jgi:polar amino acid transport system substrate-binding protein